MKNQKVLYVTQAAIVAALYVVFTFFAYLLGIDKMAVQVRFSEALCVLPFFIPSAVPGLFIGCLISNLIFGAQIWDFRLDSNSYRRIYRRQDKEQMAGTLANGHIEYRNSTPYSCVRVQNRAGISYCRFGSFCGRGNFLLYTRYASFAFA